jgi:sarcosine reductase
VGAVGLTMRLEMASFAVRDIQLADQTRFADGVLTIDQAAVRELILQGGDFADVRLHVARPGEPVRIIHVMDAAEPRYKPDGGSMFPGFVGPRQTVGAGRTHRLAGMAIVSVGEPVAGESTFKREAIIDMAGPMAMGTPFGATINLVLEFKPWAKDLVADQPLAVVQNIMVGSPLAQRYDRSVRLAQLKVAAYLARTTATCAPDAEQLYELAPPDAALPRVVYLYQLWNTTIYGHPVDGILPTLMHPNEILDGAMIPAVSNDTAGYRYCTFLNQNHATIAQLYAHHGVDLDFAGTIVYPASAEDLDEKEMMAEYVVKLAKLLDVQGACSAFIGGGHPGIEYMLICQKCEQAGIKTVQIMPEAYGTPDDPGHLYVVPEAVGIVSTGRSSDSLQLPAQERVIGGDRLFGIAAGPAESFSIEMRRLYGSCTGTGYGRYTGGQY